MIENKLEIGNRNITIFLPENTEACPIVYTHFSGERGANIAKGLGSKAILVAIDGVDWDRELSPWPAKRAFKGSLDFAGGGDVYLRELTEDIVPEVEKTYKLIPSYRIIAGYSLAGLFALYAIYQTSLFSRVASVSGSLWYDHFLDYMKENRPLSPLERVYFSLGDREHITRNPRLATVESFTIEAEGLMKDSAQETVFEKTTGNHFDNPEERFIQGIHWLL